MHQHHIKFNFAQAPSIAFLFCLLLGLGLSACERDAVTVDVVGLQPAQNAIIAPGSIHFSWVTNGAGDCRFRLGTADMQTILLDTLVASSQLTITPELVRGAAYRWEVTQGFAKLARDFTAADVSSLLVRSPADGAVLPLTGNTFSWESPSQGPFQFRLGDSGMVHVYVEETVGGHAYTPAIALQPGASYQWEVSQPGQLISATFKAKTIQQLAAGQHNGVWKRTQYSDPNSNVTNGAGVLSITPTGIGYTVEVVGLTSPVYVQPYRVLAGVEYCEDTGNGYPHQYTDLEIDYVNGKFTLLSHYGVGNGSYTRVEFSMP
jgi:hypothetical protein